MRIGERSSAAAHNQLENGVRVVLHIQVADSLR